MPPKLLFDLSTIDLERVTFDADAIRQVNLQRGDMEHLNAIIWVDPEQDRILGYKDVREDEFWVPGHIPGRPLLPGVIMIEAGGQIASFYLRKFIGWDGFIGFGGVDKCKFRQPVTPGCRLYLLAQKLWERHGRSCCAVQGLVGGDIVFEMEIVGMKLGGAETD
jgi:3-hydroxyacyl-[acyl-carrier-protein] dehydratase